MRRGKWGLREQTGIVDNVDKSVQNSIFPKKGKKRVCKTYPQNWGQNVDNVDNKKVKHIFCATCLVYHKVGGLAEEKTFYLDRQGGGRSLVGWQSRYVLRTKGVPSCQESASM